TPGVWKTFGSPHLYLAALVAIAMQAPVVIWNVQHDYASFGFITGGRTGAGGLNLSGVGGYLAGVAALLSPFLIWPLLRFATARGESGYARIVFWLSSLAFLAASFLTNILFHWNAIAYVVALPFLLPHLRSRILVGGQLIYGGLAIVLAGVNF